MITAQCFCVRGFIRDPQVVELPLSVRTWAWLCSDGLALSSYRHLGIVEEIGLPRSPPREGVGKVCHEVEDIKANHDYSPDHCKVYKEEKGRHLEHSWCSPDFLSRTHRAVTLYPLVKNVSDADSDPSISLENHYLLLICKYKPNYTSRYLLNVLLEDPCGRNKPGLRVIIVPKRQSAVKGGVRLALILRLLLRSWDTVSLGDLSEKADGEKSQCLLFSCGAL